MGLDCYVLVKKPTATDANNSEEVWYGRKENAIHGWMQRKSGIPADDFNCVSFPLDYAVIDEFENDSLSGKLTSTSGYFFGGEQEAEAIRQVAHELITNVRESLNRGDKPYYTSWW